MTSAGPSSSCEIPSESTKAIGNPNLFGEIGKVRNMYLMETDRIFTMMNSLRVKPGVDTVINDALEGYFHVGIPSNNEICSDFQKNYANGTI